METYSSGVLLFWFFPYSECIGQMTIALFAHSISELSKHMEKRDMWSFPVEESRQLGNLWSRDLRRGSLVGCVAGPH